MKDYQSLSDSDLMCLFSKNDHRAYTEIYNRYSGLLYLHAYRKLRNKEEARDLIQELFTVLWYRRNEMGIHIELSAYLYKAVRNKLIDMVNHDKIKSAYTNSLETSFNVTHNITDHNLRQELLAKIIEEEVNALPDRMKQVFLLSRNEYLSHREISKTLNISEQTVRKQINYALKILRPKLSKLFFSIFI